MCAYTFIDTYIVVYINTYMYTYILDWFVEEIHWEDLQKQRWWQILPRKKWRSLKSVQTLFECSIALFQQNLLNNKNRCINAVLKSEVSETERVGCEFLKKDYLPDDIAKETVLE